MASPLRQTYKTDPAGSTHAVTRLRDHVRSNSLEHNDVAFNMNGYERL